MDRGLMLVPDRIVEESDVRVRNELAGNVSCASVGRVEIQCQRDVRWRRAQVLVEYSNAVVGKGICEPVFGLFKDLDERVRTRRKKVGTDANSL
jgi:hypothetical protein